MAIENEDWLYIGGATVGGFLVGAAVHAMVTASDLREAVLSRRFRDKRKPKLTADAVVAADFTEGGFKIEVYYSKNGGVAVAYLDEVFFSPAEAAEFMDEWAEKNGLEPVRAWENEALEEMKPVPAVSLEGRRRKNK